MSGPRNAAGVNDMAQLYRTVGGARFEWHYKPATADRVAAYRAKGVRCRQFRIDGQPELFVHPADMDLVETIDQKEPG